MPQMQFSAGSFQAEPGQWREAIANTLSLAQTRGHARRKGQASMRHPRPNQLD